VGNVATVPEIRLIAVILPAGQWRIDKRKICEEQL
jgi:hypothetical protein